MQKIARRGIPSEVRPGVSSSATQVSSGKRTFRQGAAGRQSDIPGAAKRKLTH